MEKPGHPHAAESAEYLRGKTALRPITGVILGSGLGDFADSLPGAVAVPTASIPHYPVPRVEGHKGQIVFAEIDGHPIVALQGRTHFYESGSLEPVLYPISVLSELGICNLIITNAAGGINRTFSPGDIMVITDQLNLTLQRPPRETGSALGPLYDPSLIRLAIETAAQLGIPLRSGVYAGVKGPSYETAAEVEMIYRLGGDAVGMSTVFEVLLANALQMRVLGLSCITNFATGLKSQKLDHAEVTEVGNRVRATFGNLLRGVIPRF